ncbi:transcription elongation factor GreA [Patescibacteria group bacterium]|nr:transcription elongation factor GreA [Patescibacteria group bacterium]MBU1074802.1 transcription elongation factor GreA [Patescibacteria group bacterium]MBU1952423.1 transcription elongation factor GreA [Patescibacteria group bacterium]
MEDNNTFITKEGLERLKIELEDLRKNKRKEIAERIREAKELGDLSENAEYAEAKDEQAFTEGKIIELDYVIKNCQVIKAGGVSDTVLVGSRVKISANGKEFEYTIIGSNEADPANGLISNESPMGKAFLGKRVGDIAEVKLPLGDKQFRILSIE